MNHNEIAGLIREYLYPTDGKEPKGWSIARDLQIVRVMRRKGMSDAEIKATICGLALLRDRGGIIWLKPGEKVTLRAVYRTRYGFTPLLKVVQDAWYAYEKKRPKSNVPRLGKIMREIMAS
jgi:hypothetical protein